MKKVWLLETEQARWFEFEEPHDMPDDVTVTMLTETEQPAQQEQGDSICQEDDGCPTELAVLQRFWRGQPIPDEHYPAWFKPAPVPPAHEYDDETEEPCPSCGKALQWRAGGGVVCSAKCGYWFCF